MADENGNIEIVGEGGGDVFADEALDFDIVNGTLRIRFGVARPDKAVMPAKQQLVHIGRLVMPIESAIRMSAALAGVIQEMENNPSVVGPPSGETVN